MLRLLLLLLFYHRDVARSAICLSKLDKYCVNVNRRNADEFKINRIHYIKRSITFNWLF